MQNKDFCFLSHVLSEKTPGYGGKQEFHSKRIKSIQDGHSCNQSEWTLSNHVGTHIDAPFHFSETGRTLDSYPASFWIFSKPQLCEVPGRVSQIIEPGTWCDAISTDTDLLLIKTGFESFRGTENYWAHNPGLSPALGFWLRKNRPQLRVIGLDFISVTSYDHRPLGKEAHHALLHEVNPGTPLLVIEDMHLSSLINSPRRVTVAPILTEKSDGAPVTVIAEF